MDQRIAVQHLDCGCKLLSCLGIAVEHITHGQHQHSANTLAAAQQAVACSPAQLGLLRQIGVTQFRQALLGQLRPGMKLFLVFLMLHGIPPRSGSGLHQFPQPAAWPCPALYCSSGSARRPPHTA